MCKICNDLIYLSFEEAVSMLLETHFDLEYEHIQHVAQEILLQEEGRFIRREVSVTPEYNKAFSNLELLRKYYQENYIFDKKLLN